MTNQQLAITLSLCLICFSFGILIGIFYGETIVIERYASVLEGTTMNIDLNETQIVDEIYRYNAKQTQRTGITWKQIETAEKDL